MSRSARVAGAALLAALMIPVAAPTALASTEAADAPLPAPTGLEPTVDSPTFPQTIRKDIFLHWNAVSGATGYRVEVGRDDTWSDTPLITKTTPDNAVTLPVGSLDPATYTWRVAALQGTAVGHWSSESTDPIAAQFTKAWRVVPGLLTPADGATVAFPEFSWSAVREASQYKLDVSTKPLDSTGVSDAEFSCTTSRTRVTPFSEGAGACGIKLAANTKYYWTVTAIDEGVDGEESSFPAPVQDFMTDSSLPAEDPIPSATPTATPTATASATPSASPSATPTVAPPTTPPTLDKLVGASDKDKLCALTYTTPTNTSATSPERAVCSDVPTIRWTSVANATYYRVQLSADSGFQSTDTYKTQGTSWTPTLSWEEMSPTMSMYYDVQACNSGGCTPLHFFTSPSFRKVSPALGNLHGPSPTGVATFSWQSYADALFAAEQSPGGVSPSEDAKAYHLQVATSDHPAYDATVLDVTVDGQVPLPLGCSSASCADYPGTTTATWFSNKNFGDGSFVWRVQPVDAQDHKLPWSKSQAFTRDATPPSLLSVSPNSNVGAKATLKLTFSEAVTGVSSSSVTISPATPAVVSVTGPTTATITPTKALLPGATYSLFVGSAVKDVKGNSAVAAGPSFTVNPLADDSSPAIAYSSGWRPFSATNALGGRYERATPSGSFRPTASLTFKGTGIGFYTCLAPANGYLDIYVDGTLRARKSTYRSYSGCGIRIYALGHLTRTTHTIKVVGLGLKASASKGTNIAVDAFNVTR